MAREIDVEGYCRAKGWEVRRERQWVRVKACPFPSCGSTQGWPFVLHEETGAGKCFACGWIGGLTLLRTVLGDLVSPLADAAGRRSGASPGAPAWTTPEPAMIDELHARLMADERALNALCVWRCLTPETVRAARLGLDPKRGVAFPYFDRQHKPISVKFKRRTRATDPETGEVRQGKTIVRLKGTRSWLYGWETVSGVERIVVCEGEEDCLVLRQAGIRNVVSLPDGCGGNWSDANDWLDALEPFREIVLALDADPAGQAGMFGRPGDPARRTEPRVGLVDRLGRDRVRVVEWPEGGKDPTDFARLGRIVEAVAAVRAAKALENPLVMRIEPLLDEVEAEMMFGASAGESTGFPELDAITTGDHGGQLILVSGETSHGKSAFVRSLVSNRCGDGAPVLYGTFEDPAKDLVRKLVEREGGASLWARDDGSGRSLSLPRFREIREYLTDWPLFVINAFGELGLSEFIAAMHFANRRHGCRTVVLDHLHAMLHAPSAADERFGLDEALKRLQREIKPTNIRLYLVAHLEKGDRQPGARPVRRDLRGSSFLQQVPDTILFVWRDELNESRFSPRTRGEVIVAKNRTNGALGSAAVVFDRIRQSYFSPTDPRLAEDAEPVDMAAPVDLAVNADELRGF